WALTVSASTLYAGGAFGGMGTQLQPGIAAIAPVTAGVPEDLHDRGLALLQPNLPNPFRGSTRLRFSLATSEVVTLALYDPAGRELATLLSRERLGPGLHVVELDGRRLASGIYVCRLQVGGRVQTRRLVHFK